MANTFLQPVGYDALIARFGLKTFSNWHRSAIGSHASKVIENGVFETYPKSSKPDDSLMGHLEFALKYDGTNLNILSTLFQKIQPDELAADIRSKPTGKYARRIWYLYEMLLGKPLPLEDLQTGNYVDLLDAGEYYTSTPIAVSRQRIRDNLLGSRQFCPMIRRTATLQSFEEKNLPEKSRLILTAFSPEILKRALHYLYSKETKSSFEIENVKLDATRTERFVQLLELAGKEDFFSKSNLVNLQNRIVDPRFVNADYRSTQNYVGETVSLGRERIHFISPRPSDLTDLMEGMFAAHQRMETTSPVIHAAALSFGFVFMHPFEDGNGRIHRFLIHNILARRGYTPPGIMFPVSAAMLNHRVDYDAALETFSKPLLPLIDYTLDNEGHLTVHNETSQYYRYPDMTSQAEALFHFIEQATETDMVEELKFLQHYDAAKAALQEIVDMPDRLIDLFIRLCLQNKGILSVTKRKSHFAMLTDDEIARMQQAIQQICFQGEI
jgi:hypothetical protein